MDSTLSADPEAACTAVPNSIARHATPSTRHAGAEGPSRPNDRNAEWQPAFGGTIVAEVEHLQPALMLVQYSARIAFVPGTLAHIKIDDIVFRPFTPAKGGIVYAVWPEGATSTAK